MSHALATRELGATGLHVSVLGFGGAGIGNLYREIPDTDALGAVRRSYDSGVRLFDTAPFYGFGLSELRVGAALSGIEPKPVISTKVGRLLEPTAQPNPAVGREGYFSALPFEPVFDYSYDAVMRSHAESLQRLQVPRVDVLLCHDIGRLTHGKAHEARVREFLDGGYHAMRELRDSGAVRAIGLGVNEWEICVELLQHCDLDCILLAGRYTLLEQPSLAQLLPLCEKRRVSIICGGPFNSGILAVGSRAGARAHYNYAAVPPEILQRVRALETVCERHAVPLAAAALQFPLGHPAIATVVAGCVTAAEADTCANLFAHPIPREFWQELHARGLVDPRAPLPA
jgi:D-threo-aldose 1-dehydrogenase